MIFQLFSRINTNRNIRLHLVEDLMDNRLNTPFVRTIFDINSGKRSSDIIYIHESFMSFLWAYIWAIWVIVEEGILLPARNNNSIFQGPINLQSTNNLRTADSLLRYCSSLNGNYSELESNALPNPLDSRDYVANVNGLFLYAIIGIIYHEIGHVILNHTGSTPNNEREADDFASIRLSQLIQNDFPTMTEDERSRFLTLSHILPLTSFLILRSSIVDGNTHPNLNTRIDWAIQRVRTIESVIIEEVSGLTVALGFNMFFINNSYTLPIEFIRNDGGVLTIDQLINILLDHVANQLRATEVN